MYARNCAACHGGRGEGRGDIFPALAGNRLVTGPAAGVIVFPAHGHGAMPSFSHLLNDEEMAAVISYIRGSWGNRAGPVSPVEVGRFRVETFEPEDH